MSRTTSTLPFLVLFAACSLSLVACGSDADGGSESSGPGGSAATNGGGGTSSNPLTSIGGDSATGGAASSGGSGSVGALDFVPCTLDVSNMDTTACSSSVSTGCDGADIAQNYVLFPDPYACYNDCAPGVTLLKGSKCEQEGVELVWNSENEQCILNGQGYPIQEDHACGNGVYAEGVSVDAYATRVAEWYDIAMNHATATYQEAAGADAYVVDLTLENGDRIQAALSMGHGVLDGKCGSTFLVKVGDKYVLLLQTDVRAWSLELSPGANTWLDPTNFGGGCTIPEVRRIDADFVVAQFE